MSNNNKTQYEIMPNHIQTARFDLTALQKNLIYWIIGELQDRMERDISGENIGKEQRISIPLSKISKSNNYGIVRESLKNLTTKTVEFQINNPKNGKVQQTITSLVSGINYEIGSPNIDFFVPSNATIFYLYIGGGFTGFQKTIAISLNSVYAKKMYELCCRWKDKGFYSCSIASFRAEMNLGEKNKQIIHLKEKVLEIAQKELTAKADVYFTYELSKIDSRAYNAISFKIHKNTKNNKENVIDVFSGVDENHYIFCYNFLCLFFPNYVDDKAKSYMDMLCSAGTLSKAHARFIRMEKEFTDGKKTKNDIANILHKVILPEFGVKTF